MTEFYIWTFLFILMVAEFLFPRVKQPFFRKGFWVDWFYLFLLLYISGYLYKPFVSLLNWFKQFSLLNMSSFINEGLEFILCLLVLDLLRYIVHRGMHEFNHLWSAHKLHHSTERLSSISAFRTGHFEDFLLIIVNIPLALLMGFQEHLIIYCEIIFRVHGYFLHSNLPIRFPTGLNIIACPYFHASHHKMDRKYLRSNFGATFTFWDRLFGTYYLPEKVEFDNFGLPENENKFFVKKNPVVKYFYFPFWRKY